jgi:hypothetical protein
MAVIVMGNPPVVQPSRGSGPTIVMKQNPASANGTLTRVQFMAQGTGNSNAKVAVFFLISGNTLECRGVQTVGILGSGLYTYAINLAVKVGDYLAWTPSGNNSIYYTGETAGDWWYTSDVCVPGLQTTFYVESRKYSVQATGESTGGALYLGGLICAKRMMRMRGW